MFSNCGCQLLCIGQPFKLVLKVLWIFEEPFTRLSNVALGDPEANVSVMNVFRYHQPPT